LIHSGFYSEPVFVGRNRELEELLKSLALTMEGRGKFLIVSGESGIGKTRLVNHFLDSLNEKLPVKVLKGHCLKNPFSPYHPFLEAFCGVDTDENLDRLTGTKTQSSNLSPKEIKDEALGSILAELASICAKSTLILFIDDIQWADSGSLNLLSYLWEALTTKNLFIIATLDSKYLFEGQDWKLETLNVVKKMLNVHEIKLMGLSCNEISSLVNRTIGQSPQPLIEMVFNNSRGNPLYANALLKSLSNKQTIETDKPDEAKIIDEQNDLKKIILSNANKLVSEQRTTLNTASALSLEFDPTLLAKTLCKSTIEVLEALNAINQKSSLIISEGTNYRFNHALTQEILYEEIPAADKQDYHSRIADSLEKDTSPQPWQLAYHYSKANNQEKAIKYALSSGELALSLMLDNEAMQYFNYVVTVVKDDPQYLVQKEKATEGLGDALLISGDLKASQLFEQLGEQTNSNRIKVRAIRKAAYAYLQSGNHNRAFTLIRKPLNLSDIEPLETARYSLTKGTIEAWGGNVKESTQNLEEALQTFEETQTKQETIDALIELAIAYMGKLKDDSNTPQLEKSLASITRALTLSEQLKDKYKQTSALQTAFTIFYAYGLKKEAHAIAEKLAKTALSMNELESRRLNQAWSHWMTGFIIETNAMDKIYAKIFDKIEFSPQPKIEVSNDIKLEFKSAIEQCRRGEKLVDDKFLFEIRGLLYGNFCREYGFLGELQSSDEFLNRLESIIYTATPRFVFAKSLYLFSKALSATFKRQWQDANRFYRESTDYFSNLQPGTSIEATIRQWYGCSLLQQGHFEEGMQQFAQSTSIFKELEKRLTHTNILATQFVPLKVNADTDFTIRIEITNVGKNQAILTQVKNIVTPNFKLISTNPILNVKDYTAEMENKQLTAYKNETLTFTVKATTPGTYTLSPEITYLDQVGQTKSYFIEPAIITIQPPTTQTFQPMQPTPVSPAQPTVQPPTLQIPQPPPQQTIQAPQIKTLSTPPPATGHSSKPFEVFLCYKKSSAKDFADHLKAGLEELGLRTFIDSKDIPLSVTNNQEGWAKIRDNALNESKFFILIMTPGFNLSSEVVKEIDMARKQTNKTFIFFRHRNMGRRIVVNFASDCLDIGKLEQVSFESKEELLRHAVNILPCSKPS
jgi:predicted ATPase